MDRFEGDDGVDGVGSGEEDRGGMRVWISSKSSIRSSAYAGSSTSAIFARISALDRSTGGT